VAVGRAEKMMKNTMKLLGIALMAGLLLAGCYVLVDDGVGSVGIELPDSSSTGDDSPETVARIYLLNETALVEIGEETAYKIVELETVENEVSIGPVPSGPGYQVILALGDLDETTGIFVPGRYAMSDPSDPFAVIAGQATLVELESVESPFDYVPDVFGENLVGIMFVTDSFYAASDSDGVSEAFKLSTGLAVTATASLPDGETAMSIGRGALNGVTSAVPWINTTVGILPYLGGTSFSATELNFDADYPAASDLPPVLDSGAFLSGDDLYGWFQTDGGLGGVYDEDLSLADKQWLADIDLSTFISGQPVSDLAVDNSTGEIEAYFASKLGAFKLPEDVLTGTPPADVNKVSWVLDQGSFFEVVIDDEKAAITELALIGDELYLGTSRGVVSVRKTDLDEEIIPYSGLVTESMGRTVQEMAIGADYHAILTDNFLIVSSDSGVNYSVIPIYAGIVTAPTGLFLDDTTGVVLISGETGIATVDIDDI
jgi:hypothetical protein